MGLAWGPAFMRRSLFPFFLFVFCIPLGSMTERITFPLRLLVAKVVTGISQMALGLEVMRDGTMLSNAVEGYKYDVAPACSGIRSLVATFAIATIYAFTSFREHWKRALLVGSAFPLAVLGNIFRMMIIVLAAETFGEKAGANVHQNEFWSLLPYVPAILGLLLLGRWLEKPGPKPPATAEAKSP
jgi:exosortase